MTDTTTTSDVAVPGGPLPLAIAAAKMLSALKDPGRDANSLDLGPVAEELSAALLAATPVAMLPEHLWLAVRTSEQGRKARRLGKELGRASQTIANLRGRVSFWKAENARNFDAVRLWRGNASTWHDRARAFDILAQRVLAVADEWEATAGLTRASLPADGAYDSKQCQQDGGAEALINAAERLRELVGEPVSLIPERWTTYVPVPADVEAATFAEQLIDAFRRNPGGIPITAITEITTTDDAARDEQLVATAERLGDEVGQHNQTATRLDLVDGSDDLWRWVPAGYSLSTANRPMTREEVDANWGPVREIEPGEVPF